MINLLLRIHSTLAAKFFAGLTIGLAVSTLPVCAQVAVLNSTMTPICLNSCASASNEAVKNISDGINSTKFLDFNKLNTGFYINTGGSHIITRVDITTANDSPERDPSAFILSGSNNGSSWTAIKTVSIPCITARMSIRNFSFTNTAAYSWYKVQFPSVCDQAMANSMQVAEVQLYKASTPLPVKLTSFEGQLKNNNAELVWMLAQPEADATFNLQHSFDGQQFSTIYKTGKNAQALRFSYLHTNITKGQHYYRLKSTDRLGEVSYSNIVSLKAVNGRSEPVIYPNLVKPGASVYVSNVLNVINGWALFNMSGKKVAQSATKITGNTTLQLPATLAKGVYYIRLSSATDNISKKIIVE